MKRDNSTTEDEIARIIYETDIYEKIRLATKQANYNARHLIWTISININTHYGNFLSQYRNPSSERTRFLTDHIESELNYYVIEAENTTK
ncbi:hypothetical protein [uncultured Imperialibacter sp.]|uniref:hypothetical protein n=1 Tax=uncultured Imperialibacter sp. TaxID=1672639 RepID=UPI0030DC501D|tara:strand:- start:49482 stop:49751 length:270 start_codon:yes stop_codon:yes gene_type:complete